MIIPYRYTLHRDVHQGAMVPPTPRRLLWVMLNPSTADEQSDDPTIRKCVGFTRRWGFTELRVVNLYAMRATKPVDLWAAEVEGHDVVGPANDNFIITEALASDQIICAWGRLPNVAIPRKKVVLDLLRRSGSHPLKLMMICPNKDGSPMHPLMAAYTQEPHVYE
jgi:hypothetical protein